MSLRKVVFWIHLALGCIAGVVVLVMTVTGMLLTYERQIVSWLDRDVRSARPTPESARLPIDTLLASAGAFQSTAPSAITLRSDPATPAEVSFGRQRVLLINVYTGRVLGASAPQARAFFQSVENWHRWLAVGDEHRWLGRAVTGACNLGFFFLVLTGPYLWIPRKWTWSRIKPLLLFRAGLSGKARDFNWHNVIGIWCAAPLFLIVLSGVVMSYPWANNLLYRLTGSEPPAQGEGGIEFGRSARGRGGNRGEHGGSARLASLEQLWRRAEQQVPGWQSITLRLQHGGAGSLTFTIEQGEGGRPDLRSQLTLDARTADAVRWEPFSSYSIGRRLRSWFRFLHTGEVGGIAGQTLAGIASAGGTCLVWTGLWLAGRRLLSWRRIKTRTPPPPLKQEVAIAEYESRIHCGNGDTGKWNEAMIPKRRGVF